jgi:predicted AlkP superfamily phosphohydrolase/phosphomutase/Flp pilus assembly protein TadD
VTSRPAILPRLIASLLLAATVGAGSGCERATPPRVIVLGIDGADPETIDLLVSEGKLPNFARLRKEGAYGPLESSRPMLSPILWTTIATGKAPADHGIGHFVAINEKTGEQLPVTSQMRKVQAIWNIASAAGRRVAVVGWWATWPAETVNGCIVSDHTCYHFLFDEGATGDKKKLGITYPPALEATIAPLVRRPKDVTPEEASRFITVPAAEYERPFDFKDDLSHFRWALATADTYRRIGVSLLERERPDLLMVYIEGVDSTSHLFGHLFRAERLGGELAAQQARYGNAVEHMYEYADQVLGDFLAAVDADTTLVVLSDHGFQLGVLQDDPSKTRDMRRVSERYHRMQGILYLYGRGVRPGARIEGATQLDVTPTVLTLLGLVPAKDMPGRVLTAALTVAEPVRGVATYEPAPSAAGGGAPGAGEAHDGTVDPAVLERLRALGYLDAQSPQGDRNMAAMLFEAKRYAEAEVAYRKLVEAHPEDGGLRASLAGALASQGRYDDALAQLDEAVRLAPVNPEAYHNRGAILERQQKRDEAVAAYRSALRYNPQYEPSRRALDRLHAGAEPVATQTPAEQLATRLAERAADAAKRGNYAEAMQTLDEAARVAPGFARVYQYRANVAYLMGDRAAAKAALEKGLELEPDNALFRANLERLERDAAPPAAAPVPPAPKP